jgi:hypothetical protein
MSRIMQMARSERPDSVVEVFQVSDHHKIMQLHGEGYYDEWD